MNQALSNETPELRIYQAQSRADQDAALELFWEYLQWANPQLDHHFGITLDIAALQEEDKQKLDKFMPPSGRLLIVEVDGKTAGLGCLKKLNDDIGEIKRMYIRPAYRRQGLAKALLHCLLEQADIIGYTKIWLDSARFMTAAHALYQAHGFTEIEPYPESEIPKEFQPNWIFMEKLI